jgi:asparagine synthase (glutamine-hydrolysing)
MPTSYLGGILSREASPRPGGGPEVGAPGGPPSGGRRAAGWPAGAVEEDWGWVGDGAELFVRRGLPWNRLFTWDSLALLLRGYARPAGSSGPPDLERVAEEVRCHYLERGALAVEGLEGSFTLALLDGQARRVLLYRNLVGVGFTYYRAGPQGLLFGSNLADLVDAAGATPRANTAALPGYFLSRFVTGRETLFEDFYRLLPGEQVCWDGRGLTRVQRQTFASLRLPGPVGADGVERLEGVMGEVLADCAALWPGAANLLSGGVDSSYLQAVWNRVAPGDELPRSFSVSVDHPRTWPDTDYAVSASEALGTRHTLVPADGPYAGYLLDALAASAEPPNHVPTAYFGHLARSMVGQGAPAALCGEAADSLFGYGLPANQLHNARLLRALVPGRRLRRGGAALAGLLGWTRLGATLRLADGLEDYEDLDHPVNRVVTFADWPAVRACFGAGAVEEAAARRRGLLDRYDVPAHPLERLHACGLLGDAMDCASLWATLFNRPGGELLCPFLDSRVLRLVFNLAPEVRFPFRRPKDLLKRALARQAPPELAWRSKLSFGQPVFEWLAPGGQLRPLVERIRPYDFVERAALGRALARPNWFLYSLLCYDLWHKLFIERSLPRPARLTPAWREEALALAASR